MDAPCVLGSMKFYNLTVDHVEKDALDLFLEIASLGSQPCTKSAVTEINTTKQC